MADKLFLIARSDLRPGQQAVQAAHALTQYWVDHPESARQWVETSNTLAFLTVPDERTLHHLLEHADDFDLRTSAFREPDLGETLTAIAIEPGHRSQKLCRNLPLALGG